MINHREKLTKRKLREFAGGYIKTSEGVVKDRGVGAHLKRHAGAYVGTVLTPVLGTGIGALIDVARKKPNIIKTTEEAAVSDKTAAALGLRGPVLMGANFKFALRELSARSERIVEFGDGDADSAVLAALRDVASADESPAQRAMLLKRGLIEMVKGQVVITERGYKMMQEAGVPPKLTPAERRKEIAGKREFARGDYLTDNARKFLYTLMPKHRAELAGYKVNIPARGTKEAIEEARQLRHSRKLKPTVNPKPYGNGNWVSVLKHDDNWGKREFARGDYAIPALKKILGAKKKSQPHFWPSTLESMQPDYRNRIFHPPDGTFVPSLKFSGKDPVWAQRKVIQPGNSAGFVIKLQPGVAEGQDFRLRSALPLGEHANNRKWAANFIRQARKDKVVNWGKREFARGDFLRQAVSKFSDVAPAVAPGVSPSVIGPRGKEWRAQFLQWARKRAAKPMM